ncbi:hypothetical protein GCM10011297_31940 [Bacterioplanes sanyensis]|uniref:hypothetical protein n=1 Tax=Bacterioplanes sanyensis TaxID=1249553 RepID=UPI0016761505|nr:hypothetical protein [Bacterioplanes sanyensis]GGY56818.1 hypothetical protein GCM10011297_31940 [Bacterioplanes sanyensis]
MSDASSLPANKKYNKKKVRIGNILFGGIFFVSGLFAAAMILFGNEQGESLAFRLLMALVFGGVFGGVGGAIIWFSLKNDDLKQDLEKIRRHGIPSLEKSLDKILTVVAAVVAVPGFIIAMLGLINWEGYGFNSLLFFLFSGVLYLHARNMRRDYEKIGPTVVFPDPIPAIIGHEVGGFFMLAAKPRNDLTLRLSCLHTYSSGSGDNSSTSTQIIHQQETAAYLEPQGDGVQKVSFLFQLPEDKPESDSPEYRGTISWELSATGMVTNDTKVPGTQISELIELKRTWKLPVLSQAYASALGLTAEASHVSIPQQHQQSVERQYRRAAENSVEQQIDMQTDAQGATEIISEAGRNSSMWGTLLGLGAIFGLVGLGLLLVMLEEGGALWLIAPVFTLVGWGLFALGVFLAGRKLEARIYQGNVQVIRSVFGRQLYQRSGQITSPSQLSLKETMSSTSQDHVKTEYMAIYADIDGKKIKLAEGIEGRLAGEVMMDKIKSALTQELDAELS